MVYLGLECLLVPNIRRHVKDATENKNTLKHTKVFTKIPNQCETVLLSLQLILLKYILASLLHGK